MDQPAETALPENKVRLFVYRAMTLAGSGTFGLTEAADRESLSAKLRESDKLLVSAWAVPGSEKTESGPKGLPAKDQLLLNEQLASLLSRGVPLTEALGVAAEVVSEKTRDRINGLAQQVGSGASFAGACQADGGFDIVSVGVYRAAERSGDLAGAADRLAVATRRRLAIAGKAVTALIYPCVILLVAVCVFVGMMLFLVPQLSKQITSMSATVELPLITRLVFGLSAWMNANTMWLAAGLGVAVVLLSAGWPVVSKVLGNLVRKIGVIGNLLLASELARFFSVMGAMTKSGVPIAEALESSVHVLGHRGLRKQLGEMHDKLVEGGVLRDLIEQVSALPLGTRKLLIAADRAGDLDQAFDGLASDAADEVERQSARALALLEPVAIVALATMIAPIILGIAMGMITASQSVN